MTDAPGKPRTTIVTLSRSAGVSTSTVSRALKGDPSISPSMRARIAALAAEAGYMPNIMARTLSSGRSGLIGLVLGAASNPFYAMLLEELVRQAAARQQRFMIIHAGAGPIEDSTAEALLHYRVDGCLITSADLSSRAADICARNGVPVVMINRIPRQHASAVSCDNAEGGGTLARFLRAGGHRRAGILHSGAGSSNGIERERGFTEAFTRGAARIVFRFDARSVYEGGYAAGEAIAEMPAGKRPDCLFAVSDIIGMGAMDALRAKGLRVPQDISVVGFDCIPDGARPHYAITTFRQPVAAMVRRGLDLLAARIGEPSLPDEAVLLRGEIVIRASARQAAGDAWDKAAG
ncbi:LacI family DNA-binding transcriptional regulator [Neoroseomonas oryzicola]|uniref:Substrate-binding domain-containing protein n=1 Tax=Neoroseomonas oryzicola TaxID=535904 RepID=A0A9X9WF83_9PROT|nr:LacI family DNA-binding transcriptional regulator [Neoroseomonas oryzicola]MBR0658993.1 substrate-binding domain-containing protein [Neoroseomonas oryzicola]NKE19727.1 substrate-binding domain-containing protein [Neoroseomonas oryzicola]